MRLFGFDGADGVRRKLAEFEEKKEAVVLTKCEVKRLRQENNLEIYVGKCTGVEKSEKSFDVTGLADMKFGKTVELSELGNLDQFQRVTVAVKAIRVDKAIEVTGGKKKQDVVVGDGSGTARATIWEDEIGKIEEGKSYRLCGMLVREYLRTRFLSTSREKSRIEEIDDIGAVKEKKEVAEEGSQSDMLPTHVKRARIVGVLDLEAYRVCMKCKGKVVVDEEDEELGECSKCKMVQCMDACKNYLTTRVIIAAEKEEFTLRAFGKTVLQLCEKASEEEVTKRGLLKAKAFDFVHDNGIIQSVSRRT